MTENHPDNPILDAIENARRLLFAAGELANERRREASMWDTSGSFFGNPIRPAQARRIREEWRNATSAIQTARQTTQEALRAAHDAVHVEEECNG